MKTYQKNNKWIVWEQGGNICMHINPIPYGKQQHESPPTQNLNVILSREDAAELAKHLLKMGQYAEDKERCSSIKEGEVVHYQNRPYFPVCGIHVWASNFRTEFKDLVTCKNCKRTKEYINGENK